jgi:antirestriction protein ArdC
MARSTKANVADEVVQRITTQLIADIEAGAGEWKMPWLRIGGMDLPRSIKGHWYRGINVPILTFEALDKGYTSGVWGTYDAWKERGGQVRKGETHTKVVLWVKFEGKKKDADATETDADGKPQRPGGMMMKTYRVFSAEQQDGWVSKKPVVERNSPERLAHAEDYFAAIGADVRLGGNRAYYDKLSDYIRCPDLAQFEEAPHFYSTLGHEHIHWSGHRSRLDREFGKRFGDNAYGAEELVAELGAALLSAKLGIDSATRKDHAAYLSSWLRVLKQDARSLITVMSKAQAAVDHLDKCAGATDSDEETAETPASMAVA